MPVVVTAAALLLITLASRVVPPKYGRDRPPRPPSEPTVHPSATTPTRTVTPPPPGTNHPLAVTLPVYVLLGVIAVGLVWGFVHVVLTRFRTGRRDWRRPVVSDGVAAAQLAARIEAAVDDGLEHLAHGPVTDAIIACWLGLEDAASGAGIALRRSDTPAETVVRVLGQGVRRDPLRVLADLYREARFSRHVMDEPARAAARSALEDIRTDLARPAEAEPATDGAARG